MSTFDLKPPFTWDQMIADARSGAYALKVYELLKAVHRGVMPVPFDPSPFHSIESVADSAKEWAQLSVTFARMAGTLPPEPWGN